MRRSARVVGLICLSVLVIGFAYGYLFYKAESQKPGDQIIPMPGWETPGQTAPGEDILAQNQSPGGEKISPDATLILSRYYVVCGHTITEETAVPADLVNRTLEELTTACRDWEVREFSNKRVMLLKRMSGKCPEHYILREKDGRVAVYYETPVSGIDLKEVTPILIEGLRNEDRERLKKGIPVASKRELAHVLEDLGS